METTIFMVEPLHTAMSIQKVRVTTARKAWAPYAARYPGRIFPRLQAPTANAEKPVSRTLRNRGTTSPVTAALHAPSSMGIRRTGREWYKSTLRRPWR